MKLDRPILAFDVETTGVDPVKDRIVQIGVSVLHPDFTINPRGWQRLFNPGIPIPAEATAVHGITDEMVKESQPFSAFAPLFLERMQGKDLATYNGRRLDLPVLDQEMRRVNLKLNLEGVRIIDAQTIFFKKEPRSLADAVKRYCKREHVGAHGAGEDAAATLDVLLGQLGEYEDVAAMELDALAQFCVNGDNAPADIAGKLYRDKDGFLCYGFGKNAGARVKDQPGYAQWMASKDFPGSTMEVIAKELGW
jgi:DNA polymerase-3 subunit epsilon